MDNVIKVEFEAVNQKICTGKNLSGQRSCIRTIDSF